MHCQRLLCCLIGWLQYDKAVSVSFEIKSDFRFGFNQAIVAAECYPSASLMKYCVRFVVCDGRVFTWGVLEKENKDEP